MRRHIPEIVDILVQLAVGILLFWAIHESVRWLRELAG